MSLFFFHQQKMQDGRCKRWLQMHVRKISNDDLAGGELSCLFWKRQRCHLTKHGICARNARPQRTRWSWRYTFSTKRPGGRRAGHGVVYRPGDTNLKGSVVAGPPPRQNGFANLLRVYAYWCSHFLFFIFPFSVLLHLSFFSFVYCYLASAFLFLLFLTFIVFSHSGRGLKRKPRIASIFSLFHWSTQDSAKRST